MPPVPDGLTPPEFVPALLDGALEGELLGAEAPGDADAPPEGVVVVAVVLVRLEGVDVVRLAADPPGTVSAADGLVRGEVEPPPPPHAPSPAASARHHAAMASIRRVASTRGSVIDGSDFQRIHPPAAV